MYVTSQRTHSFKMVTGKLKLLRFRSGTAYFQISLSIENLYSEIKLDVYNLM